MSTPRIPPALAIVVFLSCGSLLFAADQATGTFHFGKTTFKIANAVAYQRDGKDPKKPETVILAADFKIDVPDLIAAIDPVNALVGQVVRNQAGNFVMIRLNEPTRCGIWAFLDSSKEVDLGDSFSAKTAASTTARVAGECSTSEPEKTAFNDPYDFHLTWDLPITSIPKPTPVPAGGGEPGHALVALIDAIRNNDWAAAHLHLREDEVPKTAPKAADMKHYFEGLALNYPKSAAITGGLVKGDHAMLQMTGTTYEGKKIRGDFAMLKSGGNWRVADMSLYGVE